MLTIIVVAVLAAVVAFLILKKSKSSKQETPIEETPLGYETTAQPAIELQVKSKAEPKKRGPKPKAATTKVKATKKSTKKSK